MTVEKWSVKQKPRMPVATLVAVKSKDEMSNTVAKT